MHLQYRYSAVSTHLPNYLNDTKQSNLQFIKSLQNTTMLFSNIFIFFVTRNHPFYVTGIVAEIIILMVVSEWLLNIINDRNPEGRPMKGIYMMGLFVAVLFLCLLDKRLHMNVNLAAFMVGLALPREGRVSRLLVNNINFFLNSVILPLYLVNVCLSIRHSEFYINPTVDLVINMPLSWPKLLIAIAISNLGKILGTVMTARYYGMQWLDAIALGQFLNIKGYYHIFCAYEAWVLIYSSRIFFNLCIDLLVKKKRNSY
jgi:Kef-type K+ transport system membrane component KefB